MIEGNKIILRLFTPEDLDEYVALLNTYDEQGEYLDARLRPPAAVRKEYEESNGWWGEERGGLAIATKQGRLLGLIGFFRSHPMTAGYEVGYGILRRQDRGKGYGTEALRIFSSYLFDLKPIARLYLLTAKRNMPARRIAEKCGYQLEGTFPQYWFIRGQYQDAVQYGLLREDCPSLADVLER